MICPECGAAMVAEPPTEVSSDPGVKDFTPGRYECPNGHYSPPITQVEWERRPRFWSPEVEAAQREAGRRVGEQLADLVKGLSHQEAKQAAIRQADLEPPPFTEVEAVEITMTHGELSVLSLGVSETSTKAQREHAREVLWGYAAQAFDAIADEVIHRRPE